MKWLTILFSLFIMLIIVLADMGKLSSLNMLTTHNLDKVGHFVLYGILTLLFDLTFLRARRDLDPNLLVFRVGSILALIIGVEEFSQRYFASRHSDIVDLTFSYLGIICFSRLALRIKQQSL